MNRLLLKAFLLPALISLLGLHSKGKRNKRPRTHQSGRSNKQDSREAEEVLDQGDVDQAGPPPNGPSRPPKKPKKPKPQFKASEQSIKHAWDDHKKGSQYDRDGQDQNIWHDTKMSEERLRDMIATAQNPPPGLVQQTPRNPNDPRGGYYYDYNTHDAANPTGRNGQTGIRIATNGDGEMVTAFPWPHTTD